MLYFVTETHMCYERYYIKIILIVRITRIYEHHTDPIL